MEVRAHVFERRANAPEKSKKDQRCTRCFGLPDTVDEIS